MSIRSSKKYQHDVYLQDSISVDKEGNSIALIDLLCSDNEDFTDNLFIKMKISKMNEVMEKMCIRDRNKRKELALPVLFLFERVFSASRVQNPVQTPYSLSSSIIKIRSEIEHFKALQKRSKI